MTENSSRASRKLASRKLASRKVFTCNIKNEQC